MIVRELIEQLKSLPQDKRVDFIVWDGDDNWNAEMVINEFEQCIDFELVLEGDYIIVRKQHDT